MRLHNERNHGPVRQLLQTLTLHKMQRTGTQADTPTGETYKQADTQTGESDTQALLATAGQRGAEYLLGSPARPTGKYVTTVQMRDTKSEYGIRCKAAGKAKEKASKNIMRRCFQNTGSRSTYTPVGTASVISLPWRQNASMNLACPMLICCATQKRHAQKNKLSEALSAATSASTFCGLLQSWDYPKTSSFHDVL